MTDSIAWLKPAICAGVILLSLLAALLWFSTPELFDYFNMAFCAH